MAKPSPIGEQVARVRVLRAWSQEELAHRAGVAVDTVRKLESGTRGMVRLHTLSMISAALDVELSVALVAPSLLPPVAAGGLLAIRTALTSADLVGLAEYAETGPVPDLGQLAASVDTAWTVWQAGQYDVLAATLSDLIAEARHAVRETTGDDQVTAYGLLATSCQVAAGVTVMVGAEDLAWTAVERSVAAAEQSGDQLSRASAAQFASWIYRRQGRYAECQQLASLGKPPSVPAPAGCGPRLETPVGRSRRAGGPAAADTQRLRRRRKHQTIRSTLPTRPNHGGCVDEGCRHRGTPQPILISFRYWASSSPASVRSPFRPPSSSTHPEP